MLDLIYFICLAIFLFWGFRKGFVIALFSVVALIVGAIGALKISGTLAASLFVDSPIAARWTPLISYILVFFILVWIIRIFGIFIQKSLSFVALGLINRVFGALLYGFFISFVFSIFLWLFTKMGFLSDTTIAQSVVLPILVPLAPRFFDLISAVFPFVKSSYEYLNDFFEQINTKISCICGF